MQEDIVRHCEDCGSDCEGKRCLVCEESQCRDPHQQRLEALVQSLADRVAAQYELLSRRAER